MNNSSLKKKEKNQNLMTPAILLAIYAVWEILAMAFDFADLSTLCLSPVSVICIALISILLFVKKSGSILIIPFGLLAITYILNIYFVATGTYYAYFPLDYSDTQAKIMLSDYLCNIFVIAIDFALCAIIILLLIASRRSSSSKGNKNVSKYALLVLVIIRLLIFLVFHLPADSLIYMPFDYAAYYLLTPFIFYIGLLLCGFQIADGKKAVQEEHE